MTGGSTEPQQRGNSSKPPARVRETAFVTGLSLDARAGAVRVLIVEDNAVNRRVASGILQKFGCMVTEADNGKAALRILEAIQFDLVFMDLQMPAMDGLETTAILRADERWKNLPIIAMTAHAMKGDRDNCLEAGMSDYIAKPIRIDEIRNVIEKWAPRNRLQATSPLAETAPRDGAASRSVQSLTSDGSMSEDPGPAPPDAEMNSPTGEVAASRQPPHRFDPERRFGPEPLTAEGPPVNMAMALTNLAGDDSLFREVLISFAEGFALQFEAFQEACARADLQRLGALAHTLKGSASNVCAEPTRRLARRIEELSTEGGVEAVAALLPELKEEADRVRAFAATLVRQEKQDA